MVLTPKPVDRRISARVDWEAQRGLYRLEFPAMGTRCRVLFAGVDKPVAAEFARRATEWVARFEGRYSRFMDTSIVSTINAAAGRDWVAIDSEMERILALCDDLHFTTNGLLDPTTLPLIELWDYKAPRSRLPAMDEIARAKSLVGWPKVERRSGEVRLPDFGMRLDFGGFGKEYAVDKVAGLAMEHGVSGCLVDFGQDIRAVGSPPDAAAWHVGLEDPQSPGGIWTSLALKDCAVATSGDYLRFFEFEGRRYGHIVDPRTGRPVSNGVLETTVIAPSCLEAGTLSTAAFTAGVEDGLALVQAHFGAEACMVTRSDARQTPNFYAYVVS